ncbi:MAG: PilZ domain-containing protein [Bacillota bacterium]|nr:PilZ domain-containing protein [Bacillota bacterium]
MNNKWQECLLPSRSIEIEVEGRKKPFRTLIESGVEDGMFRVLAPMLDGRTYIMAGIDTVNVVFSYQESGTLKVSQVKCRIVKKGMMDGLPVVTLEIIGEPVPTQRRRAFRVNVLSRIVGQIGNDKRIDMTTKDISVYGMFLYSDVRIERGKVLKILWNFEGPKDRLDDEEFLDRAFSGDADEAETIESKLDQLVEKNAAAMKRKEELKEERSTYFIIDAHVVSCDYDKEIGKYAVRLNYDHITESHTKRILQFLYKKQAEILSNDPDVANRIDNFFAKEEAEKPLPTYISVLTLCAFVLGALSIIFFMLAKPADSSFMDAFFDVTRNHHLKATELRLAVISSTLGVLFELVSFVFRAGLAMKKTNRLSLTDGLRLLLLAVVAFYIISFYVNNVV